MTNTAVLEHIVNVKQNSYSHAIINMYALKVNTTHYVGPGSPSETSLFVTPSISA